MSVKVAIMILSMRWHEKCRADYRKHPQNSPVLKQLEDEKKIKIVGSMYHLTGGKVEFFEV